MTTTRKRLRRRSLAGALIASSLVLAACGGDDDSTATPPATDADDAAPDEPDTDDADDADDVDDGDDAAPDTEPDAEAPDGADVCTDDRRGGEITVTGRGIGATINPYLDAQGTIQTGYEGTPFYSTLLYFDLDSQEYRPLVAESIESNDDASVWTLTLRDGVEFGNGAPLDADALVAHLDYHLGPESTSRIRGAALQFIAGYEAEGDLQVRFDLTMPYTDFPFMLTGALGMVQNIGLLDEIGEDQFNLLPVGGGVGPYELVTAEPPERYVLEAKDDWWGGPVCIERITVSFIPDLRANYDAYQQGETDVVYFNRDPETLQQAVDDHPGRIQSNMFNNAFMVMPNAGLDGYDGPLLDVRVRQAIAHAIDPDVINERAWGGAGWASKGLVHPDSVSIEPTEGLPFDPDRARELLDEVKAETGWDGSLTGIASATPPSNREAALTVASMLEAVGFDIQLDADMAVVPLMTRVIVERDFDLVLSWGMINGEQQLYAGLRTWGSTNPGNQNGFQGPLYDAALDDLRVAATAEEYQAALEAIQEAINEEVPYVTYGSDLGSTLYRENLRGVVWHNGIDPHLHQAYLAD